MDTELKNRIIESFKDLDPIKIIVFGSHAKNLQDSQSDLDVIVVYQTDKKFLDRLEELYLKWNIPKAVDILAYTPEEFERMLSENTFIQHSVSEGITVYERTH